MAVNKVIYQGETLVDLTDDTVTPETLAEGTTAHAKNGEVITGTATFNAVALALKNGSGEYSLELPQTQESFSYSGSYWSSPTYETGTTGDGALSLTDAGKNDRTHYLNIGKYNVILSEDNDNSTGGTDGGIVAGYKNITNSYVSNLFGAWNRSIDSMASAVGGYQNTITSIILPNNMIKANFSWGQGNYIFGSNNCVGTIGYYLTNNQTLGKAGEFHIGRYNKVDTEPGNLMFTVGNGEPGITYHQLISSKPTFEEAKKLHQYAPAEEFRYYILSNGDYIPIDEDTTEEAYNEACNNNSLYQCVYAGRRNAFEVTADGRARLYRTYDNFWYENKDQWNSGIQDNDIMLKKDVKKYHEYYIKPETTNILKLDDLDFNSLY